MDWVAWPEYGEPKRFCTEREAREYLETEAGYGWVYKYMFTVGD